MSETVTIAPKRDPQKLDDVLLAMDVVDTLRHRREMVARELDSEGREEDLLRRLKEIYAAQGIDVPDHIIREGVQALEEKRFVYEPPGGGVDVALAKIYVSRDRWLKPVLGGAAAIFASLLLYNITIAGPAERRAEATRIELTETIPTQLVQLRDEVQALADEERADVMAETYYQNGMTAIEASNRNDARQAVNNLETLKADINAAYDVTIVSRPGEMSGVFRIPDDVPGARNYYLIVEAIDPAGKALPVTVSSEEDQSTKRVRKWGQRVTEETFNRVAADKGDDQIIQDAVIGQKETGRLTPEFESGIMEGAILEW